MAALTFSAPAPTGAGLSAFLDAYLKGRGLRRDEESDDLRRILAAMQLLQAGQSYQAGERTATEQALVPEAIRSALAVPQQTVTFPPAAVPGSEVLPPDVSEYYTGRGIPTVLPGETVPTGRTLADVSAALKPEQLYALLKHAPGVLPAMGLQSEEQIRQRERREQGVQKGRVLQAEINNLIKAGRVTDWIDKEIEFTGVLSGMVDTPERMANIQARRQNLVTLRQTQENSDKEKRDGPGEVIRLVTAQQKAVQATRDGTPAQQTEAMGEWLKALSEPTTETGRRLAADRLAWIAKTGAEDLVADPTERNFWKAISTEVQSGLAKNEPWSKALLVKSARVVVANPAHGAMLFKLAKEKTLPDWLEEAVFGGDGAWTRLKAVGMKDPAIGFGILVEEGDARKQGRAPDILKAGANAQAFAQGKRPIGPDQLAALASAEATVTAEIIGARQEVRDQEKALQDGRKNFLLKPQLAEMEKAVKTAKEHVTAKEEQRRNLAEIRAKFLSPELQEAFKAAFTPPPPAPAPAVPDMNRVKAQAEALAAEAERQGLGKRTPAATKFIEDGLRKAFPELPPTFFRP